MSQQEQPHVVIIGGGFGGFYTAQGLKKARVRITLIDRTNHHCFQPLLYQVATGGLSPANIASPLRALVGRQKNLTILMASVTSVDAKQKQVLLDDGSSVSYDYCIVAAGARTNWFRNEDKWGPNAPGLKSLEDALYVRRRVFSAFEDFERNPSKPPVFVVAGGGPTGIEMAGAIAELAHATLVKDFKQSDPALAKVILVEAGPSLLGPFPERLQQRALEDLTKLGVEVRLRTMVKEVEDRRILLADQDGHEAWIDSTLLVWATGVVGSPLGQALAEASGQPLQRGGRVLVDDHCRLPGFEHTFVIGDLGYFPDLTQEKDAEQAPPLPGVAPVAMQQGRYVAKTISQIVKRKNVQPFVYWDKGSMATIGRNKAVAVSSGLQMTGFIAWVAWLFIHIMYLAGAQNRLIVLFQWGWAYVTYQPNARLITRTPNPDALAQEDAQDGGSNDP